MRTSSLTGAIPVLTGSYTHDSGGNGPGIAALRLDPTTGHLSYDGVAPLPVSGASFLAAHPSLEQQPESDHRFEGHDTWSGLTDGLRWRAATGWWSYRLTDRDDAATGLQVTHLSDRSAGSTRVLVDGRALGTLTPSPDPEGEETSQVLPLDATGLARTVEIRFEAVGPATTIRLREVRLLR
ncbi:DUF6805 domain-containing protein [Streptomyces sp. NBC_01235]|uniref:DUF6805 domain-containing protein n=1 Tax=Streptomyces sp. NBC_01235 TaxID=2903788 RepID=UPI002E11C6B2|nr:hypothetical protein OG289_00930 [Streptomyces sp. NBC_01235]